MGPRVPSGAGTQCSLHTNTRCRKVPLLLWPSGLACQHQEVAWEQSVGGDVLSAVVYCVPETGTGAKCWLVLRG